MAREAGVSVATVSRVLNGRPHVATRTRETVMRAARKNQFSTNRSARGLSSGRTGLVGVTLPFVHATYFSLILSGVADALYDHDLRAVVCPTRHEHEREIGLLERLMGGTTDGAILILPSESSAELEELDRVAFPFVVLDPRETLGPGIVSVAAQNAAGAREATRHLLELGHRRIAVISGPDGWTASDERLAGHHAALAGAGVLPDPALEARGDFTVETGREAALELLARDDPPTAIFALNDDMALGAIAAAREQGLRVPEDLSVLGFDDSPSAPVVTPALTTVRQPLDEMGRMAVSLLTRLLDGEQVEHLRIELETKLVVRASTGRAVR